MAKRWYGSVMNRISENSLSDTPTLGMGATLYMFSDRLAGTVTDVRTSASGKTVFVTVTEDDSKLVSGSIMSEAQRYDYSVNPLGRKWLVKRKKNGAWATGSMGVTFGDRRAYRDPSF